MTRKQAYQANRLRITSKPTITAAASSRQKRIEIRPIRDVHLAGRPIKAGCTLLQHDTTQREAVLTGRQDDRQTAAGRHSDKASGQADGD